MNIGIRFATWWLVALMAANEVIAARPIVIAHRGASAYLPEHTLLAVTAAHTLRADYIEQDVVLTRDGVPIVLHDIHLQTTTDVATRFPDRARADGHWYAIDFDLEEIRQLSVTERRNDAGTPVFSARFPQANLGLRVPTLAEEIELIQGLNQTREHSAGLYIEFKAPQFHAAAGFDIAKSVLAVLDRYGLNTPESPVFLQCFDPDTLKRLSAERATPLPLIQLIGEASWDPEDSTDYEGMLTPEGLAKIADYAEGIGPWIPQLFNKDLTPNHVAATAHELGMLVHPYTLRQDALALPVADFNALQSLLFDEAKVDGAFSDFPDLTRDFIDQHLASTHDESEEPSP